MTNTNLLADTTGVVIHNPKTKALEAPAPNAYFEPGTLFPVLSVIFFILSSVMIVIMLKAGGGKDYGD